ncbi:MAG: peptide chain release factor 2 [Rickettsiales bacterium]|nr:peptide chain release factor 2 [Rickettsiales bacterium]
MTDLVKQINKELSLLWGFFDINNLTKKLKGLEQRTLDENLWNDRQTAEKILKEKSEVEYVLGTFNELSELFELYREEGDDNLLKELQEQVESFKIENLFKDDDKNDCFLEINTGVGGVDANDFSEMLLNMYIKWCDKKKYKYEIINFDKDEIAGIKSATVKIKAKNGYGLLKNEKGIHRLVRQSPYNASAKRQTSFSSVDVYPVLDDNIKIEIKEQDLKIDVCRASGAGGQHVNKTDSAVRILHIPTGTVVECQEQRSQHQNKDEAMKMLKSKLYKLEIDKREQAKLQNSIDKGNNGWGSQIRNYVLHPYKLVKDLRTGWESGNTDAVLDGELLDEIIKSYWVNTTNDKQ